MLIIPSTYLPSISQVAEILASQGDVMVDLGEHYIKRSERNRARIMTAQGVMELTVPVQKANKPRQPMREVRIDNSKRWQHQHWIAILSAYKSSPYFDHYAPYIEPIYRAEYDRLVDLNVALLRVILKLLQQKVEIPTSDTYIDKKPSDLDLRPKGSSEQGFTPQPYIQVFEDRQPFVANLSILDLLFCEGPTSVGFLVASRR